MEIFLSKTVNGVLAPLNEFEAEKLKRFKQGAMIRAEVKTVRNNRFHRKFFALIQLGFDAWEPEVKEFKGFEIQKDMDHFREDVTIAAGHYVVTSNLHGAVRLRAKSISFAKMEQPDFEKLYSSVANVLLQRVLTKYTRADLDQVIERILGF